ncbi:putative holin-like toxin [Lactococcus petauri]|uniref:Holin-like toxin n=2 Tax=Lactococcus TaxID=1357 RepID=A0AA46TVR3_9LACT|nr:MULTISPECIES: putative holin-like toxin [Lactococcus]MDC0824881.1 putative holin-like toxin [Lactococcus petauri]USI69164.1 putative holin-like toxin [Lactococcus petauri]UYT09443.1 putative holin-like toxin [Lactococcus garvieae]
MSWPLKNERRQFLSIYETLSLMIAFALLMITVVNKNDKK